MIQKPKSGFVKDAIFISYTSLKDFLNCPRAYYLKNLYRDPKTGYKLQVASPYLSLGASVHDAIEWYLVQEQKVTYGELEKQYRNFWLKFRAKRGGFESDEQEGDFGRRGIEMIKNFHKNAKVLEKKRLTTIFPKYTLFENVILLGNFDFVGEMSDETLQVIDFKTGSRDEKDSLQLHIYAILAEVSFQKSVSKISYWYLDRDDTPKDIVLEPLEKKLELLKDHAKTLKKAIEKNTWICSKNPDFCRDCTDYQAIIDGKAEFQFSDFKYKKDIYYLQK